MNGGSKSSGPPLPQPASIYSGVDWLSCSAPRDAQGDLLWASGAALLAAERGAGNTEKPWRRYGLTGSLAGQVVLAYNAQHVFVQLSGERARTSWKDIHEVSSNTSRLDLQVTAKYDPSRTKTLSDRCYRIATAHERNGRPATAAIIHNSAGGSTLYLGSRSSDRFGRLYDKGVESGTAAPGVLWRWEVELKRESARLTAGELSRIQDLELEVTGLVEAHFERWGLHPIVLSTGFDILSPFPVQVSDLRTIAWLEKGVRPAVQRLIRSGKSAEVYKALGLSPEPLN